MAAALAAPLALGMCAASAAANGPAVIVKVHQASGIISPYFKLAAAPGRAVSAGSLELVNPTARRVTVRLDPVNGLTTNTLGSDYAQPNAAIRGSATWLRLSRHTVLLPAHADSSVGVLVHVPSSARPGDYLSGVTVQALGQSQTASAGKGLAIGEIDRYAIGVELTLPGPRHPEINLTGVRITREPAGLAFILQASNTGNVILKNVRGRIRVTRGNRQVAVAAIGPGTFVSHTTIGYPLRATRENPLQGTRYHIQAVLHYPGGVARLSRSVVFGHRAAVTQQSYGGRKLPQSGFPWGWLIVSAAVLVALAGLVALLARRRRPLSRAAGMRLLERALGRPDERDPISIVLLSGVAGCTRGIAAAIRPRLRRTDRICGLGDDDLLVICPNTSPRAAAALADDLSEHLGRHPAPTGGAIRIGQASATTPTTGAQLIDRARAAEDEPARDDVHGHLSVATQRE